MIAKKYTFVFCMMTISVLPANAQDVIVQRDGTTILSKVTKVGTTEVEYKKWDYQDGPTYAVAKTDLLCINYQNGSKEDFSKLSADKQAAATGGQEQGEIAVPLDEELNKQIIEACNTDDVVLSDEKEKRDKRANSLRCCFYAKDDAQFANEEIEVRYEMFPSVWRKKTYVIEQDEYYKANGTQRAIAVSVKNKTNNTIFIDLGNTFFIRGEEAAPYYVPSAMSTTEAGSTGTSVNLGSVAGAFGVGGTIGSLASGVNVGGSKSNASTTVTYSQRVISVPPMSTKQLSMQYLFLHENKNQFKGVTLSKLFPEQIRTICVDIVCNRGEKKTFTYETSPVKWGTYITYSTQENFSTYSHLSARFYLGNAIGGYFPGVSRYDFNFKDFSGDIFRENIAGNAANEYVRGFYFIAEYKAYK